MKFGHILEYDSFLNESVQPQKNQVDLIFKKIKEAGSGLGTNEDEIQKAIYELVPVGFSEAEWKKSLEQKRANHEYLIQLMMKDSGRSPSDKPYPGVVDHTGGFYSISNYLDGELFDVSFDGSIKDDPEFLPKNKIQTFFLEPASNKSDKEILQYINDLENQVLGVYNIYSGWRERNFPVRMPPMQRNFRPWWS